MENFYRYSMQMHIEKGLQSQHLADVLTTITECARSVREYPFPQFVHTVLFRLAQAFQGEMFGRKFEHHLNTIRLRIVTTIRECNTNLCIAFSPEEIVRSIMKVSHSNDYKARSLTLLLLASLAPLVHDDKKVHNLIIESLDCKEQYELSAAIQAASEIAKYSEPFSGLILQKIAEMFVTQIDHSTRIELIGVLANLKSMSLIKHCFQLGRVQIESGDAKVCSAVYNFLTKLACNGHGDEIVPELLSLLFFELGKMTSQRNNPGVLCILKNLVKLASLPALWGTEHILRIRDLYLSIEALHSGIILCTWLSCMEVLSTTKLYKRLLSENHNWIILLKSNKIVLRIYAIKLILNLADCGGDAMQGILFDAIRDTLGELKLQKDVNKEAIAHIFLALATRFVQSPHCSAPKAQILARSLLDMELCLPFTEHFFKLLAVICETYWTDCHVPISSLLFKSLSSLSPVSYASVPMAVFSILLSTMPTTCFSQNTNGRLLPDLIEKICSSEGVNHWQVYRVARAALRYGHWRTIATPLLKKLRNSCDNLETKTWLMALTNLSKAQPSEFSIAEFQRVEDSLQSAYLYLRALSSSVKDQPFWFAIDYVTSLYVTMKAIRFLLTTIDAELLQPSSDSSTERGKLLLKDELSNAHKSFAEARQKWITLCSKSFDADTQTLLQMGLLIRMCLLLEQYLEFLCASKRERPSFTEIILEDLGECTRECHPNAQVQNHFALLRWAKEELLSFHMSEEKPSIQSNLLMLRELLKALVDFPLGLPRFYFQRIQHTKIKLIISPQPSDARGVFRVSSVDLLPVCIEGIIESSNEKPIESVCVVLTLRRDNTAPTDKRQLIQLEQGDKYFKAQFLLKITHQKATKISAKVLFVDKVTKKQWVDESDTATLTVELVDKLGDMPQQPTGTL